MFRDYNGKLSFSRILSCILIFAYLIAMFYILIKEHKMIDVPLQLAGLIATIYGLNRVGTTLDNKYSNKT